MTDYANANCYSSPIMASMHDGKGHYHHHQLSLDNFLDLLDEEDSFHHHQDGLYPLAPEESHSAKLHPSHSHRKTLSGASFIRGLSSDNFLQLINEEVKELTAYNGHALPMQPSQPVANALAFQQAWNEPPGLVYPPSPPNYYHADEQPLSMMCHQVKSDPSMLPQGDMPPLLSVSGVFSQANGDQPPMLTLTLNNVMSGKQAQATRPRRTCSFPNCPNRKVQGGLCISHGAKRKTCGHPGCAKHVKKAGLCSTHGPARKRCEVEGCTNVSVQGGRCIAHGAKKKACSIEECTKQGILGGMCKKHHDAVNGIVKVRAPRKKAKRVPL